MIRCNHLIGGAILAEAHQILISKLREHSRLTREDLDEICSFNHALKELKPNEDLIRQGDVQMSLRL